MDSRVSTNRIFTMFGVISQILFPESEPHLVFNFVRFNQKKNNKTGTTRNNSLNKCAQYSTCAFACNEKLCKSGEKKK